MAKWLPLAQVEPFATTIRSAAVKPRKRSIFRRLAGCLVVLLLLVVAGGALYIYWNEWDTIGKVNALIAAEDYEGALATLRSFRDETYFYRGEASYLSALAAARQFASAVNAEDLAEDALGSLSGSFRSFSRPVNAGVSGRSRTSRRLLAACPRRLLTTSPEAWQSALSWKN